MKNYLFEFDITGKATISIDAKDFKSACKKLENGEGETELNEWDFDFPYHISYDPDSLKNFLCNEEEI